jgi:ketosteroid isomerase-like protein
MAPYLRAPTIWRSSIPGWAKCTVAVEGRFTGTHTGPLATDDGDVEPTGATVDLRFADVSQVHDGKIVAYHTYYDQLGLLSQLGLMGDT